MFHHSAVEMFTHLCLIPGFHAEQQENVMSQRHKSLAQRAV